MTRAPRITAQVANGADAYVAFERELRDRGPNGEATVAEIWHTDDHGRTWRAVPWRRSLGSFLSRAAFARWPPEWVNRMCLCGTSLVLEVREDHGLDSRWDPIWHAVWNGDRWRVCFHRHYDSEVDGPITPASLELELPGITTPPSFGPFR